VKDVPLMTLIQLIYIDFNMRFRVQILIYFLFVGRVSLLADDCAWDSISNGKLNSDSFHFKIVFEDFKEGRLVLSYQRMRGIGVNDTISVNDNKALLKGVISDPTLLYIEHIETTRKLSFNRVFFLDKGTQSLFVPSTGDESRFIHGSKNDSIYCFYLTQQKFILEEYRVSNRSIANSEADRSLMQRNDLKEKLDSLMGHFVASYSEYYLAGYLLFKSQLDISSSMLESLYNLLSSEVRSSVFGEEVARLISASEGHLAPDFVAKTNENIEFGLSSVYRSERITMLYFWATWCKPCKQIMPNISDLFVTYGRRGFRIVGVANDNERELLWKKQINELGIGYMLNTLDVTSAGSSIGKLYAVLPIPTIILIDSKGKILFRATGTDKIELLKDFLEKQFQ
jgi:thiol-disulfide isomerase/thioredoxin